jgi:four helix bundle protein
MNPLLKDLLIEEERQESQKSREVGKVGKSENANPKPKYMPFKFEELIVWQKSLGLSATVDEIAKKIPKEELYILAAQIKRAADSVSLNIAEGSTGQTNAEFKRFLSIALRSDIEVVGCIFLAKKRNIISEDDFKKIYTLCEEVLVMINALRASLK